MKAFLAAILACGLAAPAVADSVYESIPDLTAPSYSEYCSPCGNYGRVYDRFSLLETTRLFGASFTVGSWYNWPSDFTLGFFTASGGKPGQSIASFTYSPADTTMVDSPYGTTVVSVDFADFVLEKGDYFFSAVGAKDLAIPSYLKPGAALFSDEDGFYDGETTGFSLAGKEVPRTVSGGGGGIGMGNGNVSAVPEPEVWALLVAGFGMVGTALRLRGGRRVAC